jgi:S-DNA-T family DNA segregation ATPase FtsK/SpoIIIE
VSGSTVIPRPEAGGITCERLLVLAAGGATGGVSRDVCDEMLLAEEDCCPPPAVDPCAVCAGGITAASTAPVGEGSTKTCGDLEIDKNTVEEGSDECTQMKVTELVCCPAAPESPCRVCPGGTPTPGREVSNGKTCGELVADAGLVESTSAVCPQLQLAEPACCPPAPNTTAPTPSPTAEVTVFESCRVCPDGITAPDDETIGDGKTCGGLLADALATPAATVGCQLMRDAQLTCCPTPAANPCPVCPGGITVADATAVGSAGKTCADLLVDKLNTEEGSDTCTGMFEVAGSVCCPPTATTAVPTGSPTAAAAIKVTDAPVAAVAATTTGAPNVADATTEAPTVANATAEAPTVANATAEAPTVANATTEAPTPANATTSAPTVAQAGDFEATSDRVETTSPSSAPVAASVVTYEPTVILEVVEDPSSEPPDLLFAVQEPASSARAGGGSTARLAGYCALAAAVYALCAAA